MNLLFSMITWFRREKRALLLLCTTVSLFFFCCMALAIDGGDDEFMAVSTSPTATPPLKTTAIVLGNEVLASGLPHPRLAARLDRAFRLYRDGFATQIIVSGGVGSSGHDEAKVMGTYLRARGVPQVDVLEDSAGINTHATSINAAEMLDVNAPVIAVSQRFHVSRCKMSLRNAGFKSVKGAAADYVELRDFYAYARETLGWLVYWLKKQ